MSPIASFFVILIQCTHRLKSVVTLNEAFFSKWGEPIGWIITSATIQSGTISFVLECTKVGGTFRHAAPGCHDFI